MEAADEADSLALEAASEVEEACLTAVLRVKNCDWRRTARDAVTGILKKRLGRKARTLKNDERLRDSRVQLARGLSRASRDKQQKSQNRDLKPGSSGKTHPGWC